MQKLFTEFTSTTAAQWKEQLVKDLKGIDFETLISKTNEEIDIQPFYTAEDSSQKREPIFTHNDWAICERIFVGHTRPVLEHNQSGAGCLHASVRLAQ